eukprot:327214-Amphidinium_carterae.1
MIRHLLACACLGDVTVAWLNSFQIGVLVSRDALNLLQELEDQTGSNKAMEQLGDQSSLPGGINNSCPSGVLLSLPLDSLRQCLPNPETPILDEDSPYHASWQVVNVMDMVLAFTSADGVVVNIDLSELTHAEAD